MSLHAWKQGDNDPLEMQLNSTHQPSWVLDGTTVFNMRRQGASGLTVTRGVCEVIDSVKHWVRFRPTSDQTNHPAGVYNAEFEWTDSQGTIRTFPNGKDEEPDFFEVEITQQLA